MSHYFQPIKPKLTDPLEFLAVLNKKNEQVVLEIPGFFKTNIKQYGLNKVAYFLPAPEFIMQLAAIDSIPIAGDVTKLEGFKQTKLLCPDYSVALKLQHTNAIDQLKDLTGTITAEISYYFNQSDKKLGPFMRVTALVLDTDQ